MKCNNTCKSQLYFVLNMYVFCEITALYTFINYYKTYFDSKQSKHHEQCKI